MEGSLVLISLPAVLGGRITYNRDSLIISFGDIRNQVLGLAGDPPCTELASPVVTRVITDGHWSNPLWTGCFHIKPHFLQLGLASGWPLLLPSGRLPSAPSPCWVFTGCLISLGNLGLTQLASPPHQPAQGPTCCGFVTTGSLESPHPPPPQEGGVDKSWLLKPEYS